MNQAKAIRGEQENAGIRRVARIETEIEAILAGEEELMPSSGFVASVMEQVRQEAALPAPTPFPWIKAILILLLASGVFGWGDKSCDCAAGGLETHHGSASGFGLHRSTTSSHSNTPILLRHACSRVGCSTVNRISGAPGSGANSTTLASPPA